MGRWWWLFVAAAVLGGWWWWRRDQAHKGQGNPLGVPAGATAAGALAVLQTGKQQQRCCATGPAYEPLPMVGLGTTPLSRVVNNGSQAKPAPPPAGKPARPKLPPGSKCPTGKKAMSFKSGANSWIECV